MNMFSSIVGSLKKTTKMEIASVIASKLDYVISEAGIDALLGGSVVLDSKLNVDFVADNPKVEEDIIAAVAVNSLDEAEIFNKAKEAEIGDMLKLQPFVDQLAYAALQEFEVQYPAFAELPTGDEVSWKPNDKN